LFGLFGTGAKLKKIELSKQVGLTEQAVFLKHKEQEAGDGGLAGL
jgi:hypothetical protein